MFARSSHLLPARELQAPSLKPSKPMYQNLDVATAAQAAPADGQAAQAGAGAQPDGQVGAQRARPGQRR